MVRCKAGSLWGRAIKQINFKQNRNYFFLKKSQLAERLTSWLFTKRGRGFEQGTAQKQIQASGQRRDLNLGPPQFESAPLTTQPGHIPLQWLKPLKNPSPLPIPGGGVLAFKSIRKMWVKPQFDTHSVTHRWMTSLSTTCRSSPFDTCTSEAGVLKKVLYQYLSSLPYSQTVDCALQYQSTSFVTIKTSIKIPLGIPGWVLTQLPPYSPFQNKKKKTKTTCLFFMLYVMLKCLKILCIIQSWC